MAEIYTKCGKYDKAIELLDYLLSIEGEFTINDLRFDQQLSPLQEMPEFQVLLEKYALPEDLP